jgi:hypothetical protein
VLYGSEVELLVRTFVATWYSVTGVRRLRIVITLDPKGEYDPRAFFSTEVELRAEQVLENFARRWPLGPPPCPFPGKRSISYHVAVFTRKPSATDTPFSGRFERNWERSFPCGGCPHDSVESRG